MSFFSLVCLTVLCGISTAVYIEFYDVYGSQARIIRRISFLATVILTLSITFGLVFLEVH